MSSGSNTLKVTGLRREVVVYAQTAEVELILTTEGRGLCPLRIDAAVLDQIAQSLFELLGFVRTQAEPRGVASSLTGRELVGRLRRASLARAIAGRSEVIVQFGGSEADLDGYRL